VPSSNSFTLYSGYNVSAAYYTNNVLTQYTTSHRLECLATCNRIAGCMIAMLNTQSRQCTLFGNSTCDGVWATAAPLNVYSKIQLAVF
jgi:predicted metal-binding protein